ncbi:ORF6N domain-containing protein [Clostridioides difficile]|uniref:ORF6N domain-containing protein n=1 Tax=Clostridioides difficile TaxID=1496 RepID=UPI001F1FA47E|nr:ORF6N domain-containing protein [Clostridioides difficile]MCA0852484.1 ORF6N domain-containing protein [Clostridioides difficile]MCA0875264.1 ORF6N domain-containing protein [Clostridioides difficile]MCO5930809.1 ORF6N domain-containing protein [Clostridioides difficile]MCP8369108.1 ORF6N domain-containing protein [Clostridioides difficile]MCP8376376.1 ORF6N domain-containing protein [Clostridioides difficile]
MSNLVLINNQEVQVKEFNHQRVVTFKEIDKVHERVEGTAGRNFRENKKHFIEEEDYFFIKPSDIGSNEIRRSEINNSGTYLITETGYLMLVKSFTDDLAWKVQRQLVNSYFRVKEEIKTLEAVNESIKLITPIFEDLKIDKSMQFLVAKTFFKKAGVDIPLEIEEKEHFFDTKQIATKLNMYSKSNKPAFVAVCEIIKKLDIKEEEKLIVLANKDNWNGTTTKYSQSVIDKISKWIEENNRPAKIAGEKKNYHVVYKIE